MSDETKDNVWRPRDPARIDRLLALLREVWLKEPHWRLGQIVVNSILNHQECNEVGVVYCMEDDRMERLLMSMSATISNSNNDRTTPDAPRP